LARQVPSFQGADRGPRAHLRRGCEPTGGANFSVPHSVILIFLLGSRWHAHHQPENVNGGPPRGAGAEGPAAATTEVEDVDGGPKGGAGAEGPGECRSSPLREAEPGAMGHVAALEPTSAGRRGPELRNTWQRRSSTQQGGEVRGRGTHGGSGAHLCREV
jgi:hypothetical protein